MNANGVRRALARMGEDIIIRRTTGTKRIPADLKCRAWVSMGAVTLLVGGVQQNADKVIMTDDEWDQAQWDDIPRQGDTVLFDSGRASAVQGRADVDALGADRVFTFAVLGIS